MDEHFVTLFEIRNATELNLNYRLVGIEGNLVAGQDDEDLPQRNLNLLAKLVAIRERTPVAIVSRDRQTYLAVRADARSPARSLATCRVILPADLFMRGGCPVRVLDFPFRRLGRQVILEQVRKHGHAERDE